MARREGPPPPPPPLWTVWRKKAGRNAVAPRLVVEICKHPTKFGPAVHWRPLMPDGTVGLIAYRISLESWAAWALMAELDERLTNQIQQWLLQRSPKLGTAIEIYDRQQALEQRLASS